MTEDGPELAVIHVDTLAGLSLNVIVNSRVKADPVVFNFEISSGLGQIG